MNMKNQRIITLFFPHDAFAEGHVDVTQRVHEVIPEEDIEGIKYIMQSPADQGLYISVVMAEKKKAGKGSVGF